MPANKNKLFRLQTILSMMRTNSYPNFNSFMDKMKQKDIAGVFELSRKTFYRDIDDLKEEFNAPILYDAVHKGFYLTDNEWYSEELMLEPFEMKAALLGERVASSIFPEPLRSEIQSAVNAFLMKNETGMDENAQLDSLQFYLNDYFPNVKPEIFKTAYIAWEQRKLIKINYSSLRGKSSEKLFEPYILAWNGGNWYLKGKLLKENDIHLDEPKIQVLALHRIQYIEILQGIFYPEIDLLKSLERENLFDFDKIPEVIMEFTLPECNGVIERFSNQKNITLDEQKDKVTVHFKEITEYMAIKIFFSEIGDGKIISPDCLKQKIIDISKKILTKHTM